MSASFPSFMAELMMLAVAQITECEAEGRHVKRIGCSIISGAIPAFLGGTEEKHETLW
jgi:hypothetical protein